MLFSWLCFHPDLRLQWQIVGGRAVGIDLGTTHSCVGVCIFQNLRTEIIPNDHGNRTTPSYVAIDDYCGRLVGEAAQALAIVNPSSAIFDVKRLIGRKMDDPTIQQAVKHWPFKVVAKDGNKPHIQGENH